MKVKKTAIVGTTESSDVQIMMRPNPGNGREINLNSIVSVQFGDAILKTVHEVLDQYAIDDVVIDINDKGAFDLVIRARMQAAVCRACEITFDWKKV